MLLVNRVLCKTVCLIFGIDILNNESAILKTACPRGHEICVCVVSAPLRRMFPCPRRHRRSISQFFSQGKEQSRKKTMLYLYHKIKPTTRKHPAWLKTGLLTVTDEKFGFVAQSAYVFAKNKSR